MTDPPAAELFADLVAALAHQAGVTLPDGGSGFGSDALKVNGSIFAMLSHGRLVVKLPRDRVVELIGRGEATPFDAGKGTPMKEWLTVSGTDAARWLELADEARTFVGRRGQPAPRIASPRRIEHHRNDAAG